MLVSILTPRIVIIDFLLVLSYLLPEHTSHGLQRLQPLRKYGDIDGRSKIRRAVKVSLKRDHLVVASEVGEYKTDPGEHHCHCKHL